jgi:transcriptional regulator with XRE-family HTH domain
VAGVGALIRAVRLAKGMSQETLAAAVGKDQTYISQVERGVIKVPGRAMLRALSVALDIADDEMARAAGLIYEEVPLTDDTIWQAWRGRLPASLRKWAEWEQKGERVELPRSWADAARAPIFAVQWAGDSLSRHHPSIEDGDIVVCETSEQPRHAPDNTIVLARVGAEVGLWVWRRAGYGWQLCDGDGNIAHELSEHDDYTILGTFVGRYSPAFLRLRR